MKLCKSLTVDGRNVPLVEEDVRLEESAPGRATFRVRATEALSGAVRLDVGYTAQGRMQAFFLGYVESSHTVDATQQRLMCRELTGALYARVPLAMRHPTLRDVLGSYASATGLVFTVPEKAYADRAVACFQAVGSGVHGLASLGDVFGISEYVWQQQGDGRVFVGSWADSRWASRPVTIAERWFKNIGADGGKVLPAMPPLRPGALVNGCRVRTLQLKGHEMVIKW